MRRERYLEKLEVFEEELGFIDSHVICDGVTERALLHSLQICVEISIDIVSMLVHDLGLVVGDDYTNIEKIEKEGIIGDEETDVLKGYNGLRNAIVHKYSKLNMERVAEGLDRIGELYDVAVKLTGVYESVGNV